MSFGDRYIDSYRDMLFTYWYKRYYMHGVDSVWNWEYIIGHCKTQQSSNIKHATAIEIPKQ